MRESAKFIAPKLVGFKPSDVYEIWKEMGLVIKNNYGDWVLTPLGKSIGGKMSGGDRLSVPTFDTDKIIDMMIAFRNELHK